MKIVLVLVFTTITCACLFSYFSTPCTEEDRRRRLALLDLNNLGELTAYPLCQHMPGRVNVPPQNRGTNARVFDVLGSPSIIAVRPMNGYGSQLELVSLANAKSIKQMRMPALDNLGDVRISPDLAWAAAAGTWDDAIHPIAHGVFAWRVGEREPQAVLEVGSKSEIPSTLSWSPDSKNLLVSLNGTVTSVTVSGGARKVLADGTCPRWSPDGAWIAYLRPDEELALLRMEDGTVQTPLPGKKLIGPHLEWTPDSALLNVSVLSDWQRDSPTLSYLGVLEVRTGRYLRMGPWVWGRVPLFRWIEGGEEDILRLATIVARSGPTY